MRLKIHEHEPIEADRLLTRDEVDLVLTYDYNLAPTTDRPRGEEGAPVVGRLGPRRTQLDGGRGEDATGLFRRHRESGWIVNSRNTADEEVVHTLASMAGFAPTIAHRVDSLELVQDLIRAGLGVGLLPLDQPTNPAVDVLPLHNPTLTLRAYTATRRGRSQWAPLAVVLESLQR